MGLTKRQLAILGFSLLVLLPVIYFSFLRMAPAPLTVSSSNFSSGNAPKGPFEVTLTLSEPPALNKTVVATISVQNMHPEIWPGTAIELYLFKRTSPYNYDEGFLVWKRIPWRGEISPNGVQRVSAEIKVEEPGLYMLTAWGMFEGVGLVAGNGAGFHLNVTEHATAVSTKGFIEPEPRPPDIPYLVKMDLDGVPAENRPVNLRVTIASLWDQKNATFKIFLPEGYELVSGDLVWQGDLQKAMDATEIGGPGVTKDKIPEATLQRIPEGKIVRMRATIKNTLRGDARIFVFPSQVRPPEIDCDLQGLYIPHPLIGKEVSGGWQAISRGGCLNVRTINETDGISSEQKLPLEPRPQKRRSPTPSS